MNVITLFNAVADKVKEEQNGPLSYASFNIKLRAASLWLEDYLTGDVEGIKPPEPYNNQKLRDWASTLLITTKGVVEEGKFPKPADYYMWDAFSIIGSWKDENCGDIVIHEGCDTPIEILDSDVFNKRCFTYIKSLKPSISKPIAKIVGSNFELLPADLGSVQLTYKKYVVAGEIKVMNDPIYNQDIPDPVNSINSDWPDYALNLLVWYISEAYAVGNRENALTEQLQIEKKSERA